MPTTLDRLDLLKRFGIPTITREGNGIEYSEENLVIALEDGAREVIVPSDKKIEIFGYFTQRFNGDRIPRLSKNLSRFSWENYPPDIFYKRGRDGLSSLLLNLLDCHAIYESESDLTIYFLLPKPISNPVKK